MVEPDAGAQAVGYRQVGFGHQRRRVVLQPGQPPGTVHPDPAQEPDLADRRADVRGQPRSRGEDEKDVGRWRVEAGRHVDHPAHVRAAEHGPGQRVPDGGAPPGCRDWPVPALPRLSPVGGEARADARDAHLLPGRGGRRGHEQVDGEALELRDTLLRDAFDRRSPGRREDRR